MDGMFIIKIEFPGYGGKGTTCKRRGKNILACTSWDKSKNVALVEDKKLHVLIVAVQAILRRKNWLPCSRNHRNSRAKERL
jgi:hypothetical protein